MIQIKAHDDVVENVDFEKLACSDEVTGDFDVGLGWCRFTAYAAGGISGDPNAHGVKIELSAERSLLLPFDQFAFAELKGEGKQQHLRLVFATHEVSVRGNCLRRVETSMQRMELSFLGKLPSIHRSLIIEGQPVILEIVVTGAKETEKSSWEIQE